MAAWVINTLPAGANSLYPLKPLGPGRGKGRPQEGVQGREGSTHPAPGRWASRTARCPHAAEPAPGLQGAVGQRSPRSGAGPGRAPRKSGLASVSPPHTATLPPANTPARHRPDLSARQRLLPALGLRCQAQGPPLHTAQARGGGGCLENQTLVCGPWKALGGQVWGRWGPWTWPPPWSLGSEGSSQDAEPHWDMLAFHLRGGLPSFPAPGGRSALL